MLWSGVEDNYNVMVIELLGPSIQDLFEYAGMKFPLSILLKIAKQMVILIHILDSKNPLCSRKEIHSSRSQTGKFSYWLGKKRRNNLLNRLWYSKEIY